MISPGRAKAIATGDTATLYDQFGGDPKMSFFVEDLMEGIMGDSELACYHNKFQDPIEMEILKEKLIQFFKWKMDGASHYIGKPMPEVHKNLGISDDMFDKACDVFTASCKKLKPKQAVMSEFITRIAGLRSEICFPPVDQKDDEELDEKINATSGGNKVFLQLGQEIGLRQIVDSMFEQADVNNYDLFRGVTYDEQLIFKYSMFLSSLLDERYAWFYKD